MPKATIQKFALAAILLFSLASLAGAAGLNPPLPATYKTLNGSIQPGRATESMPCDGCDGQIGNMIDAESWDGASLGLNWRLSCEQISASPTLIFDGVVGGNGQRIYNTSYTGGTLWLSGTGSWGTGDPYYTGLVSSFTVITTKQYVAGQVVGVVSNINFTGTIDGYDNCFTMAISNSEVVGATPGAPGEPGPFPAFVGPLNCNLTGSSGAYVDVHDITFSILGHCSVPARSSTWGQLKSIYR